MSLSEQPEAELSAEALRAELDAALRRESDLRASLVEAHRERLESEDRTAARLDAALLDAEALRAQLEEHRAQRVLAEERALAERVRRERLERFPPLRLARALGRMPFLSGLRARRAAVYERALRRAEEREG